MTTTLNCPRSSRHRVRPAPAVRAAWREQGQPAVNGQQHTARKVFEPIAERAKGLIKQVDLLYKLASRAGSAAADLAADERVAEVHDRRSAGRLIKALDELRRVEVEQLKHAGYFHRHIAWLQLRVLHLENQKLRAARDLLLPRLMSGEIEV